MPDENKEEMKVVRKSNKWIIVLLIIVIIILCLMIAKFIYEEKQEEILKDRKYYSLVDTNFYLQDGKLFILDGDDNPIQVPGDFSQMTIADYDDENHQSNTKFGNVYFYYYLDDKIYLVMSDSVSSGEWVTKELTHGSIGIPSNSKIKYMRISGNYGYIFYIAPDGTGKILKSTTEGNYWMEIETDFTLNDNCTLKFLNEFGMAVEGFLTVPSEDGEKCDLYRVDNESEETLEKIDLTELTNDTDMDYYSMPTYFDELGMTLAMDVRTNVNDTNLTKFISSDDGKTWKTEEAYREQKRQEEEQNDASIVRYNEMTENLDESIYLTDFENYNINSNEVKISEEKAKEIAEIGFQESAARIAGEGVRDTEKEYIEIREVSPNNYFTCKYSEATKVYTNIKRKAYVVTKENNMGNGVMIYVDVTTGLIIGGSAFGD